MKPKEYIKKYNLNKTDYFNRQEFLDDFSTDIKTIFDAYRKVMNPTSFKSAVDTIQIKYNNIFNSSVMSKEKSDKFWGYIYASLIIPTRINIFGKDWKKVCLEYRLKTDKDFKRRYEIYRFHKSMEDDLDGFAHDMFITRLKIIEEMLKNDTKYQESSQSNNSQENIKSLTNELKSAMDILGIYELENLTEVDVKSSFRRLMFITHPDTANSDSDTSDEKVTLLVNARDTLIKWIQKS